MKKTSQRQLETNSKLEKLFSAALQGDEASYHDFLTEVSQIIRVFLARMLTGNDKSDLILEDLVQEVLITIHNKRHLYKTGMPLLPWLKVITRHRLVDSVRCSKRIPDLVVFDENFTYAIEESIGVSTIDTESLLQPLDERQLKVLLMANLTA